MASTVTRNLSPSKSNTVPVVLSGMGHCLREYTIPCGYHIARFGLPGDPQYSVSMGQRSFTYTDGQHRSAMQRRLLKAVSEMMSLTRWEDFSGYTETHALDDIENTYAAKINWLDESYHLVDTHLFFSRWRILDHSFGPMWNADPDDRAVLNQEYWEALENIPARALQLVRK
jgi:hypothetical protein